MIISGLYKTFVKMYCKLFFIYAALLLKQEQIKYISGIQDTLLRLEEFKICH